MKNNSRKHYTYDAVVVLGMNIRRTNDSYRPTTYADHDQFGMLAGEMNIIAAELLHKQQLTNTFVFSTGTSEKTKAAFGPDVPTESEVYSREFLERVAGSRQPKPIIVRENRSVNTYSDLTECIGVINQHPWETVAIMSARYHIPRVRELWRLALQNHPTSVKVNFLVAEDVIQRYIPGDYDELIRAAYRSPEGQKRLAIEAQGLQDIKDGKYVVTEFQLSKQT